jgi:hypothetical protein
MLVLGAVLGAMEAATSRTVHAAASDAFPHYVINGSWYLHPGSPTDTPSFSGPISDLLTQGTQFDVQCVTTGDAITPDGNLATDGNGDSAWEYGVNTATGNSGFVSDQGLDTQVTQGQEIAQLAAQGIQVCGGNSSTRGTQTGNTNLQSAATVPIFFSYDRQAAVAYAKAHAKDQPPSDGACTWFASHVLWAGGLPKTSDWNDYWYDSHGFPTPLGGSGVRQGTVDAWAAPNLVQYLSEQPYVEVEPLGHMNAGNNNVPDAKPGDIIAYVWHGDNLPTDLSSLDKIEHLAVVIEGSPTNPQYPMVAEWGIDGSNPTTYPERGWTFSVKNNEYLQYENGQGNMFAYLIHIRSDDDLNITNGG